MATKIVDLGAKKIDRVGMITPEQCRAARGWLNWTQDDLALRARVSLSTVRDFEKGRRMPIANNLDALRRAISAAGVQVVFRKGRPVGIAVIDKPDPGEWPSAEDSANGP